MNDNKKRKTTKMAIMKIMMTKILTYQRFFLKIKKLFITSANKSYL